MLIACRAVALRRRIEHLLANISELNVDVHGKTFANSSSSRLSHAGGMGTAHGNVAFMASPRRDQFPGFIRSRHARTASDGRGARSEERRVGKEWGSRRTGAKLR